MKGGRELHLEDYVNFFYSRVDGALTYSQLIKIVGMNGFSGKRCTKSRIADLLRTVELMQPGRSTVGELPLRSSPCAELSLAGVIKDIASIGWQECPIVSIMTVSNDSAACAVEDSGLISTSSSSDRTKKKGRMGGEPKVSGAKRKRKSVAPLPDLLLIGPGE